MGDLEQTLDVEDPFERRRLAMLSMFLKARAEDAPAWKQWWTSKLWKPYDTVFQDLVRAGLLQRASAGDIAHTLKVAQLKSILRYAGLKVSGRKSELVARLKEKAPQTLAAALQRCPPCYVCTETGASLVQRAKEELARREWGENKTGFQLLFGGGLHEGAPGCHGSVRMSLVIVTDENGAVTGIASTQPVITRPDGSWEVLEDEGDE